MTAVGVLVWVTTEAERDALLELLNVTPTKTSERVWSARWSSEPAPAVSAEASANQITSVLFERGEYAEHLHVEDVPTIEHAALPKAAVKNGVISLTFSFDTIEDRRQLVERLELRPNSQWCATWPPVEISACCFVVVCAAVAVKPGVRAARAL